ncbi:MAG: 4a-hydroxytetrahydrobiopterin dehydratase, partial [Thiogranum sp.]
MGTALIDTHCQRETGRLGSGDIEALIEQIHADWSVSEDGQAIQRNFGFKNYYQTIAFVNALAWVAHQQDHHPELAVGYKHCNVHYSTHSVGGLSENDFICAARIDSL